MEGLTPPIALHMLWMHLSQLDLAVRRIEEIGLAGALSAPAAVRADDWLVAYV